jgi:hypothetical protein
MASIPKLVHPWKTRPVRFLFWKSHMLASLVGVLCGPEVASQRRGGIILHSCFPIAANPSIPMLAMSKIKPPVAISENRRS